MVKNERFINALCSLSCMEIKQSYDKTLDRVLTEHGLCHFYIACGEYESTYDLHKIRKVIKEPKKVIGLKIPFTGKMEIVANVVSEPKQAQSQHESSRLKYNGLEVHVANTKYGEDIKQVCQKLETELEEPVKLVMC